MTGIRHPAADLVQVSLEFQPVHSRHHDVEKNAAWFQLDQGAEERITAVVCCRLDIFGAHHERDRCQDIRIVIDDMDDTPQLRITLHGNCPHSRLAG